MSAASFRRALEAHLAEVQQDLAGVDVAVLNKELSLAQQFAKVTTDGRVARGLENRIQTIEAKLQSAKEPDKEMVALRDWLKSGQKMLDKMDGYEFTPRKPRTSKKGKKKE